MADSREMTYGIGFQPDGLDEIQRGLDSIESAEESVEVGAGRIGQALDDIGAQGVGAGDLIGSSFRDAADDAEDAGEQMRQKIKEVGASADSLGGAFKTSMGTMLKDGQSTAKGIQAGFQGAVSYTEKQFKTFTGNVSKGAKNVGDAFLHPIKTIKDKLGDALLGAGKAAKEAGDNAVGAGDDFKDLGNSGADAGNQVADAMKSALQSILALMAIKQVIDLVKDFTSAALDAAVATEQVGAKFDSAFGAGAADAADWVNNFSDATHRSINEVKGFMAANQGLLTGMGLTSEAAADLSKMTTSLGYDIGAALKMDDADAMSAVQKIIKGNNNALADYGILLDDTKLKTAAQAMGINESIDALDDATLAQVRFNALLAETEDLHQSAAGSVEGVTGVMKALGAMKDNFMAKAGEKFTPVVEKAFGAIEKIWPTIEPMLLNLVDILTDGLEQTVPVLETLGENLLPIVCETLGTLLEAGMPLLPIFAELAGTILPPLAGILGSLAESVLPPLVGIFSTLNESVLIPLMPVIENLISALLPPFVELLEMIGPVIQMLSPVISVLGGILGEVGGIVGGFVSSLLPPFLDILNTIFTSAIQPLLPVLQNLAAAILPPIAQLLGAVAPILGIISPILEACAPILDLIGGALGIIGDVLGKVIGFLADGVGKVTGFFSKLFGGAKESKAEVEGLSGAVSDLGAATDLVEPPALEIPAVEMPPIEPIEIPAIELPAMEPISIPQPDVSALEPLEFPVSDIILPEVEPPAVEPLSLVADTTAFSKAINTANAGAQTETKKTWDKIEESTGKNLEGIGAECSETYSEMAVQSETMWGRMVTAAQQGAQFIVAAFNEIGAAAANVANANISVTGVGAAAQLPHNDTGTDNFEGGLTYINEKGGEVAMFPSGTTIVPADKSDQLIEGATTKKESVFAPTFNVEFHGNAGDPEDRQTFMEQMKDLVREVYRECQESDFDERALNDAITT